MEDTNISDNISNQEKEESNTGGEIKRLSEIYQEWFLDYASYVILERAIPHIDDGFKPVQRRIMYSLYELNDGRYNKVANIIGNTMKYHPHGDASIWEAIVQLGQKSMLIDTQGNWGNIYTGDSAAASRYIEARLSKFGEEILFNKDITKWKVSYDGRNKEPVTLPVKFPLLLFMGSEGIAVGLSSKILPHNFNELIEAAIDYLRGKDFVLYPDFITGGIVDVSNYNNGKKGGKIKIRAKISQLDNRTIQITEIPYGTTTISLIDSIIQANDSGKIKIKKIEDNTAENVEILIYLPNGVDINKTIEALYAFTNCEVSINVNACVISNNKPVFLSVNDILKYSVDRTVELIKAELELSIAELNNKIFYTRLEKIFIEEKIYRKIEAIENYQTIINTVKIELNRYSDILMREVYFTH